jgi:pseudouridine-5'-phosphate glycosidase/pseudouridine kinase
MGTSFRPVPKSVADILVAGSVAIDLSCDYAPPDTKTSVLVVAHTSNPAVITQTVGGVGHNVAAAAHLIGNDTTVRLCSIVAPDMAGMVILSYLKEKGLDVSSIMTLDHDTQAPPQTSQYVAINDANKDLALAMADMRIISSPINDFTPWKTIIEASKPKWVVVDANWNESAICQWAEESKRVGANVAIEPVSVEKAKKLFPPKTAGE